MINKLNTQKDEGPLENLNSYLTNSNYPDGMIVSIGATSYTTFGENTFLEKGDEIIVCIYDEKQNSYDKIKQRLEDGENKIEKASILLQQIV
jgi:hypothetical protein